MCFDADVIRVLDLADCESLPLTLKACACLSYNSKRKVDQTTVYFESLFVSMLSGGMVVGETTVITRIAIIGRQDTQMKTSWSVRKEYALETELVVSSRAGIYSL